MNRHSLMLGLVAASLTVLGSTQALGFKSKVYPYTLNVPDDWQSRQVPNVDVAFAAPASGGLVPISFNVSVRPVPAELKVTADDLLALMLKQSGESVKNFKQISATGLKIGKDGVPGVELNFTGTEQSVPMHWVQRAILQNNLVYLLTYGASQSAFDKNPKLARQVMNNFQLTKAGK